MRCRIVWVLAVAVLFMWFLGCSLFSGGKAGEEDVRPVALRDLPAPARAAVEALVAGGEIRKIDREEKDGTVIFDVEATVQGKDVEYDVDSSGNILSSEESVPYASLPAAVRAATERYFGSGEGIQASKENEEGKTFYEVAGMKGAARMELKLTETGQIVEEEEE